MIIFNNLGHTFKVSDDGGSPIVWVDSSDTNSFTYSASILTTLDNKGTLGGAMTLNGNARYANSGFESWFATEYITYDLGETFLPNNSFTIYKILQVEVYQFVIGLPNYGVIQVI